MTLPQMYLFLDVLNRNSFPTDAAASHGYRDVKLRFRLYNSFGVVRFLSTRSSHQGQERHRFEVTLFDQARGPQRIDAQNCRIHVSARLEDLDDKRLNFSFGIIELA